VTTHIAVMLEHAVSGVAFEGIWPDRDAVRQLPGGTVTPAGPGSKRGSPEEK
jgi:hypothetical protein